MGLWVLGEIPLVLRGVLGGELVGGLSGPLAPLRIAAIAATTAISVSNATSRASIRPITCSS